MFILPKIKNDENGAIPVYVLVSLIALILFLFITNTFSFKDKLFSLFFPKPSSHAATFVESVNNGYGKFGVGNWPGSDWRPYGDYTPFSQPVPANPKPALNSDKVVSTWFSKIPMKIVVGQSQIPGADWNHPVYFSQSLDPVYTIHCDPTPYGWSGTCAIENASVRIPVGAKPASAGDRHMAIIDQSTNIEWDFWKANIPSGSGGKLTIGWGGKTVITGDGLKSDSTAALFGGAAGNIREVEWDGGVIDHALFITLYCDNDTFVYPAYGLGRPCSDVSLSNSTAAPMGARFYLDMSDADIDGLPSSTAPGWKKAILKAMHNYGMYLGDTGGSTWEVKTESGATYTSFGVADPMVAFAQKNNISKNSAGSYDFDISMPGTFYQDHLHMIDSCVTKVGTGDCLPPSSTTASPTPIPTPLPTSPSSIGTDLITNPGCEVNTSGWVGYLGTLSRSNIAHSGTGSCQVTFSGSGSYYSLDDSPDSVLFSSSNLAVVGTPYAASAWVRSDNAAGRSVQLSIRQRGGSKATLNTNSNTVTLSNTWQQLSASTSVDASDRTSLDVYIAEISPQPLDLMQIDDISLVQGLFSTSTSAPTVQTGTMTVSDISMSFTSSGPNKNVTTVSIVRDTVTGVTISGATVNVKTTLPDGSIQSSTATTNSLGKASNTISKSKQTGIYTSTVENVSKSGYTYFVTNIASSLVVN